MPGQDPQLCDDSPQPCPLGWGDRALDESLPVSHLCDACVIPIGPVAFEACPLVPVPPFQETVTSVYSPRYHMGGRRRRMAALYLFMCIPFLFMWQATCDLSRHDQTWEEGQKYHATMYHIPFPWDCVTAYTVLFFLFCDHCVIYPFVDCPCPHSATILAVPPMAHTPPHTPGCNCWDSCPPALCPGAEREEEERREAYLFICL